MPAFPAVTTVLYFAYGSNMDTATMRERRGVDWRRAVAARAAGWRLRLDKPSLLGTGEGMATIVEDADAEVWGVLYEIAETDYAHIELTEGVAIGHYRRREVAVEVAVEVAGAWAGTANGIVTARTMASDDCDGAIRPTTRYRQLLVTGALEHGLPAHWIEKLKAVDAAEETPEHASLRPFFDRAMRKPG